MHNKELERKIKLLREYLDKLAPYAILDSSELLRNEEKRAAMERWFQLVVDEAVDINAALAYQLGGRIPESHKSTFFELVPLNILEMNFAEKLAESVGTRNKMTHDYEKIQHKELIELMKVFAALYKEYLKILINRFIREG